jgi:tetratricopeptide (TPR) repeat protein
MAFENATTINPQDPYAWLSKGLTLSSMGRLNESIAAYKTAISLSPNDGSAWFSLGLDYYTLGNYTDALDTFNKALGIDDRNGNAWNYKGLTLHRLGRYQEAIEAFNRGLIIDPRNAELTRNKEVSDAALRSYVGESTGIPVIYLLLAAMGIIACGVVMFLWWRRDRPGRTRPVNGTADIAFHSETASSGSIARGSSPPQSPMMSLSATHPGINRLQMPSAPVSRQRVTGAGLLPAMCYLAPTIPALLSKQSRQAG